MMNYLTILDSIMEKWLGRDFDRDGWVSSNPYRMLAVLLDDPWSENLDKAGNYKRQFIVDILNPVIQRKLEMLNGPYFDTIMRIVELEWVPEKQ